MTDKYPNFGQGVKRPAIKEETFLPTAKVSTAIKLDAFKKNFFAASLGAWLRLQTLDFIVIIFLLKKILRQHFYLQTRQEYDKKVEQSVIALVNGHH